MPKLLYDYNAKTLHQFFNDRDVKRELCRSVAVNCGISNSSTINGASANRPASPTTGEVFFDTTLGLPIWYNGTDWVNAAGDTV